MSLLSVFRMGQRGILTEFADFVVCPCWPMLFSPQEINRIVHAIRFFDFEE